MVLISLFSYDVNTTLFLDKIDFGGRGDSKLFPYALDPAAESIDMFEIEADGSLTDLGTVAGGISMFAQGIAVR